MRHIFKFNENVPQAKALLKKLNIKESDSDFQKIRTMLSGHDGYVYWFTKLRFQQNQGLDELSNIWNIISDKNGLISFFSKRIVELENIEEFWDQYEISKLLSGAKKVLDQFPSKQKSFFNIKEEADLDTLVLLSKSKSLPALIKKISSFRDKTSLLEAIDRLLNSTHSGKFDELLSIIESTGANIHTNDIDNNIIICQVNYQQIRKLGGDTSWCIVRSESTFNSYASGGFQWIIFLVDNFGSNDRLSKIGLTTHVGYTTAHDKFDGHINKENLKRILLERGVNLSEFYLSKETLLTMSDWYNISVESLIEIGLDKKTIIERKSLLRDKTKYGRDIPSKNDIEFFDESDINRFNLLDRTEMTWNNISTFKLDKILSKNLLDRLDYPISFITFMSKNPTKEQIIKYKIYNHSKISYCTISNIFTVDGFTKEDFIKNKIYNSVFGNSNVCISFFTKEELIKYRILEKSQNITIDAIIDKGIDKKDIIENYYNNLDELSKNSLEFFKGKNTKEVIDRLCSTFWSDDREKLGIGDNETYKVKLLIMSLYEINSSKIKFTNKRNNYTLSDIISGIPIDRSNIDKLYELGFKITNKDEFDVYIDILSISNNTLYKIRDINKLRNIFIDDKLVSDLCSNKIRTILNTMLYSNYFDLINVKSELKDCEEWISILDTIKAQISLYDIKTKKSREDSGYNSYSFENTVKYFNELRCDKSYIEKMGGVGKFTNYVFDGKSIDDIISFFKDNGYEIDRKLELEVIENSINRSYKSEKYLDENGEGKIKKIYSEEYYQKLADRSINIEDSLEHIFEYIKERKEISDSEISKYKITFSKGKSEWISILDSEFKEIREIQFKYSAIKGLSQRAMHNRANCESWYNTYFEVYPTITDNIHRWDKFENDLKVLYMLAVLDKFDEFDKLNINFDITTDNMRGFSFDDNKFHSIAKLLCKTSSDYRRNFADFNLIDDKVKVIYNWVISKVDIADVIINKYFIVCHYLYNKELYSKCLEDFKKKRTGILRISLYRYMLKFFVEKDNIDEFKKITDGLFTLVDSNNKNKQMLKMEYKKTINYIEEFGSRDFSKLIKSYLLEVKSKYDKVLNESIITNFKYFR